MSWLEQARATAGQFIPSFNNELPYLIGKTQIVSCIKGNKGDAAVSYSTYTHVKQKCSDSQNRLFHTEQLFGNCHLKGWSRTAAKTLVNSHPKPNPK